MEEAITIFVSGLAGVFVAMAVLYGAIRLTSRVTDKIGGRKEK
jgi:Na+-transporting methylmalonyl-CoA/oxaloacetate decarboxylase gamma subunit